MSTCACLEEGASLVLTRNPTEESVIRSAVDSLLSCRANVSFDFTVKADSTDFGHDRFVGIKRHALIA